MGASFLWRRGSAFWFQIAVPKDLRSLLGDTPFRLRLPSQGDATPYARILAGVAERGFACMRLTQIQQINLSQGRLFNGRELIFNALMAEIDAITSFRADLDDNRRDKPATDPLKLLAQRNRVLEGLVAALKEKALAISSEYADFVAHANARLAALNESLQASDDSNEAWAEEFQEVRDSLASKERHLERSRGEIAGLKDTIVSEAGTRKALFEKAGEVIKETNKYIDETRELKHINKILVEGLDYRGPLLQDSLQSFLNDRREKSIDEKEINNMYVKLDTFIEVIGNKSIGDYSIAELQRFARKLPFLPERHSLDPRWRNFGSISKIIEANEKMSDRDVRYLCEKTILTNYVGRVKTAIRWLCAQHKVPYPFENAPHISVVAKSASIVRNGFSYQKVNILLSHAARGATPEEIWLPLLGLFTGARLGELVYLRSADFSRENDAFVVNLTYGTLEPGRNMRRPLKNKNSQRRFVVHEKLCELGFEQWVASKPDWVFPLFHRSVRPRNAASKRFQRLFDQWGLTKDREDVLHALRHTFKDWAREQRIEERTIALQTGHSLQGIAVQYGTKALRPDEMKLIANMIGLDP